MDLPTEGQPGYQYPGKTFILACEAARHIPPPRSFEPEERIRFYTALCREMGIPSPQWMADRTCEAAEGLLASVGDQIEDLWLGNALRFHTLALQYRRERAATLPGELLTHRGFENIIDLSPESISYYNLHSLQPDTRLYPRRIDLLTLHHLLQQVLSERRLECPLKEGHPFYCHSANSGPNTLCTWQIGNETVECLVDVIERGYQLKSK
jgi:hypothetical protein